jgi:hypothetical protein
MKMNTQTILAALCVAFLISCSSDKEEKSFDQNLLTQGSWIITENSSDAEEEDESCKTNSPQHDDNQLIFNSDESFRFDNGDVTEIEDCEDCCSDIVDSSGTWTYNKSDNKLSIVLTGIVEEDGSIYETSPVPLISGVVMKLTSDKLVLKENGITITLSKYSAK